MTSADGNPSLRIHSGLSLGEDAEGELVLAPVESEQTCVTFEFVDQAVWLNVTHPHWELRSGDARWESALKLTPATILRMPHHELRVGPAVPDLTDPDLLELDLVRTQGQAAARPGPRLGSWLAPSRRPAATRAASPPRPEPDAAAASSAPPAATERDSARTPRTHADPRVPDEPRPPDEADEQRPQPRPRSARNPSREMSPARAMAAAREAPRGRKPTPARDTLAPRILWGPEGPETARAPSGSTDRDDPAGRPPANARVRVDAAAPGPPARFAPIMAESSYRRRDRSQPLLSFAAAILVVVAALSVVLNWSEARPIVVGWLDAARDTVAEWQMPAESDSRASELAAPAPSATAPSATGPTEAGPDIGSSETGAVDLSGVPPASPASAESMVASVEQLLRSVPEPDPVTLEFAVQTYRTASLQEPGNPEYARRLAELERALERSEAAASGR